MSSETIDQKKILETSVDLAPLPSSPPPSPTASMGVASKRRLDPSEDEVSHIAAKLAKLSKENNNDHQFLHGPMVSGPSDGVTTDFLTTSILARTLLTSEADMVDPLDALKNTLESLPPVPTSGGELMNTSPFLKTINGCGDEFGPLLGPTPTNCNVTPVLSPAGADWTSSDDPVITEDESGKSYFNLGSADATIIRKSPAWVSSSEAQGEDDDASSTSCESLSSSEDLFNSGEEFEDEEEEEEEEFSSYKQLRSNVLHLSLVKLNKFRSVSKQHCVEPSLHRSVLICNTLRHIEQEIKSEDDADEMKSRERLPSFWRPSSNHHPHNLNFSPPHSNLQPNNHSLCHQDAQPYLSPNPYLQGTGRDVPLTPPIPPPQYLSYDYSRPTPYHTTSYEYEQDLSATLGTPLPECDSGYGGEELSYYYVPPTNPSGSSTEGPTSSTPPIFSPFPPDGVLERTPSPEKEDNNEQEHDDDASSTSTAMSSSTASSSSISSNSDGSTSPTDSGCVPFLNPDCNGLGAQCGMESRRNQTATNLLPIDNLISSSYSSSL